MPRLGSKKSRNGCQQCKARRVKCDENRPCGACMRYKVECSLLSHMGHVGLREGVSSASSLQQHQQAFSETSSDAQYGHVHDYTPGAAEAATASASPDSTEHTPGRQAHAVPSPSASTSVLSWMSDLELMHHYTAYAHATIPGVDQARHVWGFTVPQEGFKHQFLMHSILAFSAYHLAHLQPSNTNHYRILASTHHTAAVTTINRKLAELDLTLDPNTSHALFAAASLIVINAFADAETHDLNAILDIFHLVRGMAFILHSSVDQLQKGPFAIILKDPDDPPKPPPVLSTYLIDLQILSCAPSTASPLQTNVAHAAEKLREALQHGIERSPHPAFRACIVWPINLDPEVLECVKAGRSDGSVKELWWQFCRLLEFCAGEWWFLRGWVGVAGRVSGER